MAFCRKMMILIVFALIYSFGNQANAQYGVSMSFTTNKALGFNCFFKEAQNAFYFGFTQQFNGQKNKVVNERKINYGLTNLGDGDFYWLVDFGYSRTFFSVLTIQPELSIGQQNIFINYSDKRFSDDGYSLVTDKKGINGAGLNIGYRSSSWIEFFGGYHSIKKMNLGIRLHLDLY